MKISVILSGIRDEGNLGSIARLCDNYEVEKLILVNPICEVGDVAYQRATRARMYLDEVILCDSMEEATNYVDLLVGFTGKRFSKKKIVRHPTILNKVVRELEEIEINRIGLLFGNESTGLSQEELEFCEIICRIPTGERNPILNIANAVAIGLYSFSSISEQENNRLRLISREEKNALLRFVRIAVEKSPVFDRSKDLMVSIFKDVIDRAYVSKREINALIGFFRMIAEERDHDPLP